jgi:cephalosporin-C deacetylase
MTSNHEGVIDTTNYNFDPTFGYTLNQLLAVKTPIEPKDFEDFWINRYQKALAVDPKPNTRLISEDKSGWRVFEIAYSSTDNFPIRGWLLLPKSGVIKRGFVIGHGYGGVTSLIIIFPLKTRRYYFYVFVVWLLVLNRVFQQNLTGMFFMI